MVEGFGCRVSGFLFRGVGVSGFWFLDSGFGFPVWGLHERAGTAMRQFQFSGFGVGVFWILDSGIWIRDSMLGSGDYMSGQARPCAARNLVWVLGFRVQGSGLRVEG